MTARDLAARLGIPVDTLERWPATSTGRTTRTCDACGALYHVAPSDSLRVCDDCAAAIDVVAGNPSSAIQRLMRDTEPPLSSDRHDTEPSPPPEDD